MKNICIIHNPISGSRCCNTDIEALTSLLKRAGHNVSRMEISSFEQTKLYVERIIAEGCELIIAAGGDGTVRSIAQFCTETSLPVLIYPSGTENLLAGVFNIKREHKSINDIIDQWKIQKIDVGYINDEHFFLSIASIGVDSRVVGHINQNRHGHINKFQYIWPTVKAFFNHSHPNMEITIDGKKVHDRPAMVFVANVPRYGGGFKILPQADYTDGLLDVAIYKCCNILQLVYLFALTLLTLTKHTKLICRFKCSKIEINSDNCNFKSQIDGDPGPGLPLQIRVAPAKLSLLVP